MAGMIQARTPAFRRTTLALFAAGFSTFALMYCVQPLLPQFASEFGVSAATSSLAVSLTTGCLATALLVTGALSESWGRKRVMVASLALGALLTGACALAPTWGTLLAVRAAVGLVFAGLPAIAMAYVGEEVEPPAIGLAMGIYVSGTAMGGMVGRVLTAVIADIFTWRSAVAMVAAFGLFAAFLVWSTLPRSTRFRARPIAPAALLSTYLQQLRDPILALLYAEGFIFMGAFIAIFNYIGFHLLAPPYSLSQATAGTIFLLYTVGTISSPWAGSLAHRIGHARTLALNLVLMLAGIALTMASALVAVAAGVALLTFGFFAAHAVISAWVSQRGGAHRAQASSLYLSLYYLGASIVGALTGIAYERFGWNGAATFLLLLVVGAIVLARPLARLSRTTPPPAGVPGAPAGA